MRCLEAEVDATGVGPSALDTELPPSGRAFSQLQNTPGTYVPTICLPDVVEGSRTPSSGDCEP